jgi:GT2 family glycosyltransferase
MKKIKEPKVSIVFVNWNGKKYTFDLIESLKKINYKNFDIIVVDNGSIDGTQKDFNKKYGEIATLIENKKNLGLAEATNVGVREAIKRKSKFILTMNNDMLVDKNFLNCLVNSMEKHPEVAISTPLIYYMDPKNMIWCAGCKYTFKSFKPLNQREIDNGQANKEKYVDGCDCVLMMRTSALKKIGLFDKDFFLIHEFTELCLRATNKKFKCLFIPKSKIWHKVAVSMEDMGNEEEISIYYNIKNWLLTIKRNKSPLYFLLILFLESTLLAAPRFVKYLKNGKPKLIITYYIAIWHALINKTPAKLYPYKK